MNNEDRRIASDNKIEQLLPIYYSGSYNNTHQFLQDYDLTLSTFMNYLHRHNLESIRHSSRQYNIDTRYFYEINSADKAYWLGFIQCDAYIDCRGIDISLGAVDREHLVKLQKALNYTGNIKERTIASRYKAYRLNIASVDLVKPFVEQGLEKFRSTTMELLLTHDNPFFKHYIRGIIDANGSICVKKRKTGSFLISVEVISGSEKFAQKFVKELNLYYDLVDGINLICANKFKYRCSFRKCLYTKVFDDIYKDACISLDRKQSKVNAVLCGSV